MAATRWGNAVAVRDGPRVPSAVVAAEPVTVEDRLFADGASFQFFQAVHLLERLAPARKPVGRVGPHGAEAVRFRCLVSVAFPASAICDIRPPAAGSIKDEGGRLKDEANTSPASAPSFSVPPLALNMPPTMVVTFFGLFGPSGILPRHYTDLLMRLEREAKGPARYALRDWLDLFNHRLISLFYRAWEKYRFYIPFANGEHERTESFVAPGQDPFTRALFSCVGLATPALRNRLRVGVEDSAGQQERALVQIDDFGLLRYGGLLAQRPRNALGLQELIADFFHLPVRVVQFQGQWLRLEPDEQSRLGGAAGNNVLGVSAVAGERVWDVQGKVRLRIGPLTYAQFVAFLPDRTPAPERKAFFLLAHLARLYVGPELDFEVQLLPRAADVPPCQLNAAGLGPRLGWNTWLLSGPMVRDPDDAVFAGQEARWL